MKYTLVSGNTGTGGGTPLDLAGFPLGNCWGGTYGTITESFNNLIGTDTTGTVWNNGYSTSNILNVNDPGLAPLAAVPPRSLARLSRRSLSYGTPGGCLQEQSPEPPVTLRDLRPAPKDCRNPGRFLWYFVGFGKAKPMFVRHFFV